MCITRECRVTENHILYSEIVFRFNHASVCNHIWFDNCSLLETKNCLAHLALKRFIFFRYSEFWIRVKRRWPHRMQYGTWGVAASGPTSRPPAFLLEWIVQKYLIPLRGWLCEHSYEVTGYFWLSKNLYFFRGSFARVSLSDVFFTMRTKKTGYTTATIKMRIL